MGLAGAGPTAGATPIASARLRVKACRVSVLRALAQALDPLPEPAQRCEIGAALHAVVVSVDPERTGFDSAHGLATRCVLSVEPEVTNRGMAYLQVSVGGEAWAQSRRA